VATDPNRPAYSATAGYERVDDQDDPDALVELMDETAGWPAVIALRAFEAEHLALSPGQSLLDVGCGRAEVACALAPSVQPGGRVVGVDASEAMLADARRRAERAGTDLELGVGDATALDLPDATFDAVRCERTLQWIPDPSAAVAELVRVLRPGGRISLIDTDWRTLAVDLPDATAELDVMRAILDARGPQASAGGQLVNLCRDAGLVDIEVLPVVHPFLGWDLDERPAPPGIIPVEELLPELVDLGILDETTVTTFTEQYLGAARAGRFFMSLTMFGVAAAKPG
jgi:SAM-dependent methyltransferase